MPPDFSVGFAGKGVVVLGTGFRDSAIGTASCRARDAYLWLAQASNHQPFPRVLDGRTITVERGAWFGTWASLCQRLPLSKGTLRRVLKELATLGAVTVESVERPQRYRGRTVESSKNETLNGSRTDPQRFGNRTDVRCLGTLVKVLGWREIAVPRGNGSRIDPLNTAVQRGLGAAPRLSAAQRKVNAQALAAIRDGAI